MNIFQEAMHSNFLEYCMSTTGKKIFVNTSWLIISEIIYRIVGFLVIAYLARILGVATYGNYEFTLSIIVYFSILSSLGLNTLGNRDVSRDVANIKKRLGDIVALQTIATVIGFGLIVLFAQFFLQTQILKTLLIYQGISVLLSPFNIEWVFLGMKEMKYVGYGRIIQHLIFLGTAAIFIHQPQQILLIPFCNLAGVFAQVAFQWGILFYKFSSLADVNVKIFEWKKLLQESFPMVISFTMNMLQYNLDVVVMGFLKSPETVGWYSSAFKINTVFINFRNILSTAFFPFLSQFYKESLDKLSQFIMLTEKLVIALAFPLAVGGILLGEQIITFVYGKAYLPAVVPFQILMVSSAVLMVNLIFPGLLNASDRQKMYLKITAWTKVGSVVGYLFGIYYFGMVGGAVVTLFGELVPFLWFYFESKKITEIKISQFFIKPFLSAIVMGFVLFLIKIPNIFVNIFVGMVVYGVVLYGIGFVNKQEIVSILHVIKQKKAIVK